MKKAKFSAFLISCASACLLAILLATLPTPAPAQTSVHLTMGNPSNAGSSSLSNYLLVKSQYATSHHCSRGIPNWVSWQLNSSWLGAHLARMIFVRIAHYQMIAIESAVLITLVVDLIEGI